MDVESDSRDYNLDVFEIKKDLIQTLVELGVDKNEMLVEDKSPSYYHPGVSGSISSKKDKYLCVESYRNEYEKVNLLYWQVTCECFYTPDEWKWWFKHSNYKGDYSFIYFE